MTKFQEPNFPALFSYDKDKLRTFDKDLITALSGFVMVLKSILDAGISIGDNVDMAKVVFVSHATPGTEGSATHTLGKIPEGYIVMGQTDAGSIYDGVTPNTKDTIYLKSDVSSKTFRLLVF